MPVVVSGELRRGNAGTEAGSAVGRALRVCRAHLGQDQVEVEDAGDDGGSRVGVGRCVRGRMCGEGLAEGRGRAGPRTLATANTVLIGLMVSAGCGPKWGTRVPAGCPTCALAQNTVKGADASTS